jgi:hypothetical protein
MQDKKNTVWPGIRLPEEFKGRLEKAIVTLGLDIPALRRSLMLNLIDIAESGDTVDLPPRIMRIKRHRTREGSVRHPSQIETEASADAKGR